MKVARAVLIFLGIWGTVGLIAYLAKYYPMVFGYFFGAIGISCAVAVTAFLAAGLSGLLDEEKEIK